LIFPAPNAGIAPNAIADVAIPATNLRLVKDVFAKILEVKSMTYYLPLVDLKYSTGDRADFCFLFSSPIIQKKVALDNDLWKRNFFSIDKTVSLKEWRQIMPPFLS
jgi:hypothetical protein